MRPYLALKPGADVLIEWNIFGITQRGIWERTTFGIAIDIRFVVLLRKGFAESARQRAAQLKPRLLECCRKRKVERGLIPVDDLGRP